MLRRNRIRQGRKPENRYIAAFRRAEIAEPFVCIENSASQTECESHSPVKLVDEEVVEHDEEAASPAVLQENPASNLADDVMKSHNVSLFAEREACKDDEEATEAVAGQPFEAERIAENEVAEAAQLEEEKLIESLSMRAIVFPNNVLDYVCAGTEKNQPARYDEEFLPNAEWQNFSYM